MEVAPFSEGVASAGEETIEAAEERSRELVEGVEGKAVTGDTTTTVVAVEVEVAGGLGGKTTTSRSATATLPSMSSQSGKWRRRSISIASPSLI